MITENKKPAAVITPLSVSGKERTRKSTRMIM